MKTIQEMIEELPPELKQEVEDFVHFLAQRRRRRPGKRLRQDWAGALRDLRDQYTAVDLQKKALEWRAD